MATSGERETVRVETVAAQRRALRAEEPVTPAEAAEMKLARPKRRSDCIDAPRPCPWLGCRYHLFTEVTAAGSLKLLHPIEEIDKHPTCALDVADRGGKTLEDIGAMLGQTRERVRQVEMMALEELAAWAQKARDP